MARRSALVAEAMSAKPAGRTVRATAPVDTAMSPLEAVAVATEVLQPEPVTAATAVDVVDVPETPATTDTTEPAADQPAAVKPRRRAASPGVDAIDLTALFTRTRKHTTPTTRLTIVVPAELDARIRAVSATWATADPKYVRGLYVTALLAAAADLAIANPAAYATPFADGVTTVRMSGELPTETHTALLGCLWQLDPRPTHGVLLANAAAAIVNRLETTAPTHDGTMV